MQKQDLEYLSEGSVTENVGAIVFLVVGVGVATLVLIFVGVLGGQVYQQVEPDIDSMVQTVTNKTITLLNGTAVALSDDVVGSTLVVQNATHGVLASTNYLVDWDVGTLTLTNNAFNNTAYNASYQYGDLNASQYIKDAIISGFKALDTTGSYLPIVVLAVIIFIVLGIVMGLGAVGGMSKGANYGGAL